MQPKSELKNYHWQAINQQGETVSGKKQAKLPHLLKFDLQKQGLTQIKIKKDTYLLNITQKIKSKDIRLFTRQMATLLKSGISLIQALTMIANGNNNNEMKHVINDIKNHIEKGNSVTQAIEKFPAYFDTLYCNLILVGEKTGALDTMFERLAIYQEKIATIKAKIKKALFYPATVILVAIIVTAALLVFIVPQFAALFASFGARLPWPTRAIIHMAHFLNEYGVVFLVTSLILIFGFNKQIKQANHLAEKYDQWLLKLPLLGSILQKAIVTRITRTLATVFAAGLPLIDALNMLANSSGNIVYNKTIIAVKQEILHGSTLYQAMAKTNAFPDLVLQLISIGEISGTMEIMLNKVADIYTEEVDNSLDNLSNLLEPFIIIVLGIIIGALVIAMYLPIFKLGSVV